MRNAAIPALALLVLGCARDPAEAWIDTYNVELDAELYVCGTSDLADSQQLETTWEIYEDSAGFHIDSECAINLHTVTERRAVVGRNECPTLVGGVHGTIEITGGFLMRDERLRDFVGELNGEVRLDDGRCFTQVIGVYGWPY